ncbi:dihydrofolate reductase family protein [Actinomycetospora sp.]|jgi:dihydrofolate reductase|uniref:dihydrofolate reductase family protein n=1 Tax=Actinomycetospora sp. TaxID=1872135 RepID=UPI002F423582
MGKIVISENVTLDGVVQDPMGDEGSEGGGWFLRSSEADRGEWAELERKEALEAEALLLGRRSDEWFATRWLTRSGEWADRLNGMPKYVVSATLDTPRWSNATVLRGEVVEEVSALKQRVEGEIVVYASSRLVPTLLEHDLVDELRLTVHPVLLGTGRRLLGEAGGVIPLRLVDTRLVGEGLVLLTYRRGTAGPAGLS